MLRPQQKSKELGYFQAIGVAAKTMTQGMKITLRHLRSALQKPRRDASGPHQANYFDTKEGIFTLNFPHEQLPIPDNARYLLHNESKDCIVCNKCAEVCPVNCIDIEPVRSTEQIGTAADGTPIRMYAATFDIDMGKCCYCGLCTTVCPTQCLTMTPTFDHSEFKLDGLVYGFENITPEEAERVKAKYEAAQEAKRKAAAEKRASTPKIKPKIKTAKPKNEGADAEEKPTPKVKLRPKIKVKTTTPAEDTGEKKENPRPKIKVKVCLKKNVEENTSEEAPKTEKPARPKIKVKMRPKTAPKEEAKEEAPEAKKPARPKIKVKLRPPRKDDEEKS